jgi:hypothetical protein
MFAAARSFVISNFAAISGYQKVISALQLPILRLIWGDLVATGVAADILEKAAVLVLEQYEKTGALTSFDLSDQISKFTELCADSAARFANLCFKFGVREQYRRCINIAALKFDELSSAAFVSMKPVSALDLLSSPALKYNHDNMIEMLRFYIDEKNKDKEIKESATLSAQMIQIRFELSMILKRVVKDIDEDTSKNDGKVELWILL